MILRHHCANLFLYKYYWIVACHITWALYFLLFSYSRFDMPHFSLMNLSVVSADLVLTRCEETEGGELGEKCRGNEWTGSAGVSGCEEETCQFCLCRTTAGLRHTNSFRCYLNYYIYQSKSKRSFGKWSTFVGPIRFLLWHFRVD